MLTIEKPIVTPDAKVETAIDNIDAAFCDLIDSVMNGLWMRNVQYGNNKGCILGLIAQT